MSLFEKYLAKRLILNLKTAQGDNWQHDNINTYVDYQIIGEDLVILGHLDPDFRKDHLLNVSVRINNLQCTINNKPSNSDYKLMDKKLDKLIKVIGNLFQLNPARV